jgi:hypothetical protein
MGAISTCTNGACAISACVASRLDCDGDVTNGCEVASDSDLNNCGACKHVCGGANVDTAQCVVGACTLKCKTGFYDLDGNTDNGCETAKADVCSTYGKPGYSCPGYDTSGYTYCQDGSGVCQRCTATTSSTNDWSAVDGDFCWTSTDAACGGASAGALKGGDCTTDGATCNYYSGSTLKAKLICQMSFGSLEWIESDCPTLCP